MPRARSEASRIQQQGAKKDYHVARRRIDKKERDRQQAEEKGIQAIRDLLIKQGLDPEYWGAVKAVRFNEWQVAAKVGPKNDKRLETKDLTAVSIIVEPSWIEGPEYPVVTPAKPVSVRAPKRAAGPALVGKWKTAVFLPDMQIGFRRTADGSLDPFHDERAISVALQIVEAERPEGVVHAGDMLDFAPFSLKHRTEAAFGQTVQPAIDRAYEVLAIIAALVRWQRLISGNHDVRLQTYILENAMHAFGLKPGGLPPETWPDLSVQHLLRLDEVNCEYVGSYPAGATYLNDNLACIHGARIGNRQRTAAQIVVENERVSVLHGHTHKHATAAKTRNSRGAPKFSIAHSPGCLCRIDGAVPSTLAGLDAFGRPVKQWEDWQQGLTVVRYQEDDGKFALEPVNIIEGWAMHRGQEFKTKVPNASTWDK